VEFNIRSKAVREKQDRFKHEYGEQHMAPRIYHMHYDPEVHRGIYNIDSLEILEDRIKKMARSDSVCEGSVRLNVSLQDIDNFN
jgi:hypothetical protein